MAALETPIGWLQVSARGPVLSGIRILAHLPPGGDLRHPMLAEALSQLADWFAGKRVDFDLPLASCKNPEGERLRAAIAGIPYGKTQTYGTVAARSGSIARAVGQACKTNAFPIIIPCHRATSASGPEHYSAGAGARTKGWLIDFEASHLPPERRTRLL